MKPQAVTMHRADWSGVIESIHWPSEDRESWARSTLEALDKTLSPTSAASMLFLDRDPLSERVHWTAFMAKPAAERHAGSGLLSQANTLFRSRSELVTTKLALSTELPEATCALIREWRGESTTEPCFCVVIRPAPDSVVAVLVFCDESLELTAYERSTLSQVALHIDSAYRLRCLDDSVRGILTPDGRFVKRESGRAADRASLWAALVDGRSALAPWSHGPTGGYAVLDTPSELQPLRALTTVEQAVVVLAAQGCTNKFMAHEIGTSESIVSTSLARAASKIGVLSRSELVRLAAMLPNHDVAPLEDGELTATERDVFELLRFGLSNREIAARRSRSIRTIANQVASILKKTASPSRRALVALRASSA